MERKKALLGITLVIAILALVSIAIASIPPPPANQDLGIYDTVFGEFNESGCRACHSSGVPDRHHLLVQFEGYECLDCHTLGPGGGINEPIRDCLLCHLATPHHDTQAAQDRHCSVCHGSFVDDYDDGHYIPSYAPSLVTPDTSYRAINGTTGKKWGGCEACHEPDMTADPTIESNNNTHHNAISCSAGNICHFDPIANIRKCEDCHGVKSLHNIQYDYANTEGVLGYGHIGDNWDCKGCHAWYDVFSAPLQGPIVPSVDGVSPDRLMASEETVVTITGTNFMNTVGDNDYTSDVVIDTGVDTITLTPDSITASEIIVTIPPQGEGSCGLYVVKSDMKSKRVPIMAVPPVRIDSATIKKDTVIIRGSGFGDEPDESWDEWLGVNIVHDGDTRETSIVSWSDARIVVNCPDAGSGDLVTVDALYGSKSAEIAKSDDKPNKPPKKPKK